MLAPISNPKSTPTTNNIMLILKGKRTDGAHWLRLVVSSGRKQSGYHRSFYKPHGHRPGGVETWLSKNYFSITNGRAKAHA